MYRAPASPPLLIVAGFDNIFAIRRADGVRVWTHDFRTVGLLGDTMGHPSAPPTIAFLDDRLFACFHDKVMCIDYLTGDLVGEVALGAAGQFHISSVLVADGLLYIYAFQAVMCLDASGRVLWSSPHDLGTTGIRGSAAMGIPGNVKPGDGR